jgi:RNase adapter protein RapZ
MRIVVVTGMSGAGKSTALRALEDLDYYCVDNLPLPLLSRFMELLSLAHEVEKAALVIDAREKEFLLEAPAAFAQLRAAGHSLEVLFLDSPDDVLVRRYQETRRRHPLAGDDLRGGIKKERQALQVLREESEAVVATGELTVHQLKGIIQERYGRVVGKLAVTLLSFGFKHGIPVEADMVLDVRFLPNPYFVEALSGSTGRDAQVAAFVMNNEDARQFLQHTRAMLEFALPRYEREGKAYLTVAVGCTGGRHRSVAVVEELAKLFDPDYTVTIRHRDLER